ncbi:MAG: 3-deoxy-D-manno-octulosonic acid transferase [Candidatus Acidiferrales bacterium]
MPAATIIPGWRDRADWIPRANLRMYFLYSVLAAVVMVFLAPYYFVQGLRNGKYIHNLRERMGHLHANSARPAAAVASGKAGSIWIHAVSVGEALAALPLAQALKQQYPGRRLVVTTTTDTGQRLARDRIKFADEILYFPLDWAGPVRRVFQAIHPSLVVILETEIWPNFLREANRRGVPVVFANARISESSFRGYRWANRLFNQFVATVLQNADLILAQSSDDARRFLELGAPEDRVEITGNLKYDLTTPVISDFAVWLAEQLRSQERWPLVVAGSVAADEEEHVLAAYDIVQRQWRRALLVLAPRKPDRFDAASQIASEDGWTVIRRSRLDFHSPLDETVEVMILDSIGELAGIYALADTVFVGGSLVPVGGHNILEPASHAKLPIFGSSMENFAEMSAEFLNAGAAIQVESGERLGATWAYLISHPAEREKMGRAALALVNANRGATERSLRRISAILDTMPGGD